MRRFALLLLLALPLASAHAEYSRAPLLVVKPGVDESLRPAAPAPAPAAPEAPKPEAPAKSESPEHPVSPFDKLWPRDTVPIFVTRCTRFHVEMLKPCVCVITNVMTSMGHDEFMKLNAEGTMESDPRILSIQQKCVADLQNQKKRPLQGGQE